MALHVPRGIYTIVVSIRLDYCRRDCATSPSWSPAMKNCREQPRGRGHVTSAGLDACVAHSASAHRDRLAWELGELAAFARRKCMGGWRFRPRGVGGLGGLGEVCGIRPEEVHGRLAVSAAGSWGTRGTWGSLRHSPGGSAWEAGGFGRSHFSFVHPPSLAVAPTPPAHLP